MDCCLEHVVQHHLCVRALIISSSSSRARARHPSPTLASMLTSRRQACWLQAAVKVCTAPGGSVSLALPACLTAHCAPTSR